MALHVAYFINQYPKVCHSFIRREIQALERIGFTVKRFALRGWQEDLVDEADIRERGQTAYVLQCGVGGLMGAIARAALSRPKRFILAVKLALSMSRKADRSMPYHIIYLAEACKLLQWMEASSVRHIHAHFGTNSTEVAMLVSVLGDISYSFTVHGSGEFDKPLSLHLNEKIKRAAFVVAISSFCRSQLYRWAEYEDWKKVHIVRCGLEKEFHSVSTPAYPTRRTLVCVGRLCEQKGQMLLLNAVSELRRKGHVFQLILAGDGDMRADLEAQIRHHSLEETVTITGWISSDQVRSALLSAQAMILPSFAEGLPVVLMEAMAVRRPVLATHIAGIPELVVHGDNGWLFPAGDVERLVEVIEEFLKVPIETLEEMGKSAHARVLALHDVDVEARKLGTLFLALATMQGSREN